MNRFLLTVLITSICSGLYASDLQSSAKGATSKSKTTAVKSKGDSAVDISQGLDIIGSQDAPLELNIVPWKDKEAFLPKNALEASVLTETLDPIDRDVVRREVDFSRALQHAPTP